MQTANFLKSYTAEDHQRLDTLVNLDLQLQGHQLKAAYGHLLRVTYRFVDTVEAPLNAYLANEPLIAWDYAINRKALIAKDLADLGGSLPARALPKRFSDLPEALGFLYVLEGAALGGRVIFKRLSSVPAIASCCHFHFHAVPTEVLAKRWTLILQCLNAWIDAKAQQTTGQAAKNAFDMFGTFFKELPLENP